MSGQDFKLSVPATWSCMEEEMKKPYVQRLQSFLANEYLAHTVYPPRQNVFRALELTPYDKVKVVIVGQDPYINEGEANGLAFAVREGVALPPTLRNIFEEVKNEYGSCPKSRALEGWARQGVLLLNTTLTVREGASQSHKDSGWHIFTDAIISEIVKNKRPIVFIFWGEPAKKKERHLSDANHHLVLKSAHPSPLAAYRGFWGCDHFKKANDFLVATGQTPINWLES